MATTKKLSFGLDKAGGAALILARIGAALLWIIAALAAVVWVVFLISPRSFAANFGSVDLNVGGAFTLSIKGDLLDYSYNLQNFHDGPVNMVATSPPVWREWWSTLYWPWRSPKWPHCARI